MIYVSKLDYKHCKIQICTVIRKILRLRNFLSM